VGASNAALPNIEAWLLHPNAAIPNTGAGNLHPSNTIFQPHLTVSSLYCAEGWFCSWK